MVDPDYAVALAADSGTLAVTPATLTVAADANQSKIYGTDNPTLTGTVVSGLVNGDTQDSVGLTFSSPADPSSHVGTYAINAAVVDPDYAVALAADSGTLAVTPATLTVAADANQSKVYGTDNPTLTGTVVSGLVNGDTQDSVGLTFSSPADPSSHVGTYAINAAVVDPDYAVALAADSGTLAVTPATLTVAADANQSKVYGTDNPTLTGTVVSGLVNGDTQDSVGLTFSSPADPSSHVGTYAINAAVVDPDYAVALAADSGTLAVTPATLTVAADANQSKVYGTDNPTLTGTVVSGLVNGDTQDSVGLTFSSPADPSSHVGTYAINAAVVDPDYAVALAADSGTLAVTPATLTVTANNTTMVLGGPVPTFSAYYVGLVNGDSVSNLNGSLTFTPGDTSNAGTTTIALRGNLTDSDYTIEYNPGTLTVNVPTKPIIIGLPWSKKLS